jgi:hypothetical protein
MARQKSKRLYDAIHFAYRAVDAKRASSSNSWRQRSRRHTFSRRHAAILTSKKKSSKSKF